MSEKEDQQRETPESVFDTAMTIVSPRSDDSEASGTGRPTEVTIAGPAAPEGSETAAGTDDIEATLARIDERTAHHDSDHTDHESRIRALERESDKRKGIMAALSLFSSIVGGVLVYLFKLFFGGHTA